MPLDMSMIILSDIHSRFEYLDYLLEIVEDIDLLVCLGDIDKYNKFTSEAHDFFNSLGSKIRLKLISGNCDPDSYRNFLLENPNLSLEHKWETHNIYTIGGFGGIIPFSNFIRRARSFLHGKKVTKQLQTNIEKEFEDILYLNVNNGYYKCTNETPEMQKRWLDEETIYYIDENEIYNFFTSTRSINSNEIWFTHNPPYDFPESKGTGVSNGSIGLYNAIKEIKPFLVISGHLHKEGIWTMGKTMCLSTPPLEEGKYAKIEIVNHEVKYQFKNIEI